MTVFLKRIYAPAVPDDGFRVLVDRLWPRGVSRERAALNLWLKEIAPSSGLRTAWHQAPERFDHFAALYRAELAGNPAVAELAAILEREPVVTMLFAAKDERLNHAVVLRDSMGA